jgi:CRISPR-associated protein Csd2
MGGSIFVQSDDRTVDDFKSLRERADKVLKQFPKGTDDKGLTEAACKEWFDVRAFGQLFAFKSSGGINAVSIGIRGPVTIRPAFSVCPICTTSNQITKSVNSETGEKRGSDTMGMKHRVDHGLYVMYGSINVQLAQKTGFSDEDANMLKNALLTLFQNDCSSARPDGSMDVEKLYWWNHDCPSGQYSSAKVHSSLKIKPLCNDPVKIDDYEIVVEKLEGLEPEIY